jgi:hypothetical protein
MALTLRSRINEDTNPTFSKKATKPLYQTQLYDLEADPFERHNLADTCPDRVAALRQAMEAFQAMMKPTVYTPEIAAARDAALAARRKNPALKGHPRADGAPGHWIGGGAKERLAAEAEAAEKHTGAMPTKQPHKKLKPAEPPAALKAVNTQQCPQTSGISKQ